MAGTFRCPECGVRIYIPFFDGGKSPACSGPEDDRHEEELMTVVD